MAQIESFQASSHVLEAKDLRYLVAGEVQVLNLAQTFQAVHRQHTVRRDVKLSHICKQINAPQLSELGTVHDPECQYKFRGCAALELSIRYIIERLGRVKGIETCLLFKLRIGLDLVQVIAKIVTQVQLPVL